MKKIFSVMAAFVLGAFVMTSCSSSDDNNDSNPVNPQTGGTLAVAKNKADAVKLTSFPEGSDVKEVIADEGGNFEALISQDLYERLNGGASTRALKDIPTGFVYVTGKYTVNGTTYVFEGLLNVTVEKNTDGTADVTVTTTEGEPVVEGTVKVETQGEAKGLTSDICRGWTIVNTTFDYYEYDANGMEKNHYQGNFTVPEEARSLVYMQDWLKREHDTEIDADFSKKVEIKSVAFNQFGKFTINFLDEASIGTWSWKDEAAGKLEYNWEDESMDNDFETGVAHVEMQKGYLVLTLSGQVKQKDRSNMTYRVDVQFVLAEDK
jgi:hypothetical protein